VTDIEAAEMIAGRLRGRRSSARGTGTAAARAHRGDRERAYFCSHASSRGGRWSKVVPETEASSIYNIRSKVLTPGMAASWLTVSAAKATGVTIDGNCKT